MEEAQVGNKVFDEHCLSTFETSIDQSVQSFHIIVMIISICKHPTSPHFRSYFCCYPYVDLVVGL